MCCGGGSILVLMLSTNVIFLEHHMRAQIYGTTLPINCDKNGWLSHSIEPSSMTPCAFKLQFISYEKPYLRSSHIDKKGLLGLGGINILLGII